MSRVLGFSLLFLSGSAPFLPAQTVEEKAVVQVVEQMFAALKAGDTAGMRATLHPAARIIQTGTREAVPFHRVNSVDDFLKAIGGATGRGLEERIYHPEVRIDDNLATVWLHYDFLVGGQLSHCGVDAYQLIRVPEGWRILQIVDTQRRQGCADIQKAAQTAHDRRIDYIELPVTDLPRARQFYQRVFGWSFTDHGADYTSFADGRITGGLVKVDRPAGSGALVVLYAANLPAIRDSVVAAGGKIVRDIFEFPGGRRFHFTDPAGNELAVWSLSP